MPPSRYRIVERGGRLEVIDGETGERPQSAAERMAAHDAAHGHAALRFDRLEEAGDGIVGTAPVPPPAARPVPTDPIRAALAKRSNPWGGDGGRAQLGAQSQSEERARPSPNSDSASSRPAPRATGLGSGKRQRFVTGKWWDSNGPRTVDLGDKGRAKLSGNFMTALIVAFFVVVAMIIVQPALLLVAGFALFRFGGTIIGPIGAWLIDDALKADVSTR